MIRNGTVVSLFTSSFGLAGVFFFDDIPLVVLLLDFSSFSKFSCKLAAARPKNVSYFENCDLLPSLLALVLVLSSFSFSPASNLVRYSVPSLTTNTLPSVLPTATTLSLAPPQSITIFEQKIGSYASFFGAGCLVTCIDSLIIFSTISALFAMSSSAVIFSSCAFVGLASSAFFRLIMELTTSSETAFCSSKGSVLSKENPRTFQFPSFQLKNILSSFFLS
mmetsp:Transcript_36204/g.55602  ORF Transcript_36204/g.55602 Transcript_36204/m.55602 type:complete len:221 (+) Transcript_36204:79-741(+)